MGGGRGWAQRRAAAHGTSPVGLVARQRGMGGGPRDGAVTRAPARPRRDGGGRSRRGIIPVWEASVVHAAAAALQRRAHPPVLRCATVGLMRSRRGCAYPPLFPRAASPTPPPRRPPAPPPSPPRPLPCQGPAAGSIPGSSLGMIPPSPSAPPASSRSPVSWPHTGGPRGALSHEAPPTPPTCADPHPHLPPPPPPALPSPLGSWAPPTAPPTRAHRPARTATPQAPYVGGVGVRPGLQGEEDSGVDSACGRCAPSVVFDAWCPEAGWG